MGRVVCCAVLALGIAPTAANAQFFGPLESLFQKVDGLTVFVTMGTLASADQLTMDDIVGVDALRGIGLEVLLELTESKPDSGKWGLELAFGADYLTGFVAKERTLDLRGSLRGLPTLSAYATPPLQWGAFGPYLGLNVGFVQLWNVQGYDPDGAQYDLDGDTFQFGLAAGIYHDSGFFLEGAYRNRNFRSIRWGLPGGVDAVPARWPRSLDLSAFLINFGFQFGRLAGGGS